MTSIGKCYLHHKIKGKLNKVQTVKEDNKKLGFFWPPWASISTDNRLFLQWYIYLEYALIEIGIAL
jgi:hypothetical protein